MHLKNAKNSVKFNHYYNISGVQSHTKGRYSLTLILKYMLIQKLKKSFSKLSLKRKNTFLFKIFNIIWIFI